jgi:hypothetical protein
VYFDANLGSLVLENADDQGRIFNVNMSNYSECATNTIHKHFENQFQNSNRDMRAPAMMVVVYKDGTKKMYCCMKRQGNGGTGLIGDEYSYSNLLHSERQLICAFMYDSKGKSARKGIILAKNTVCLIPAINDADSIHIWVNNPPCSGPGEDNGGMSCVDFYDKLPDNVKLHIYHSMEGLNISNMAFNDAAGNLRLGRVLNAIHSTITKWPASGDLMLQKGKIYARRECIATLSDKEILLHHGLTNATKQTTAHVINAAMFINSPDARNRILRALHTRQNVFYHRTYQHMRVEDL